MTTQSFQEANLKDYFHVLVRRRWIVIAFCVISTVTTVIASLLMTPLYKATATVVVEGEDTNVLNQSASTQGVSFDIFENYVQTQMAVIKSRNICGQVFEALNLEQDERYSEAKDPLKAFMNDVYLDRIKGTRVLHISAEVPDAHLAAEIANRIAQTYVEDNLKRRALTFIRNQRMASLNAEFTRLQARWDALSNRYGPKHPEMIALKEEIRSMATRIKSERYKTQRELESSLETPEEQALLEDALLMIQENSVMASKRMENIAIADQAVVPTKKSKPQRTLNTLIGFLGGLVGGIFLAFFIDYLDDSIKTDEDVKRYIGKVPFLGSIFLERPSRKDPVKNVNIDQLLHLRSESPSSEAYRLVRMGILWAHRANEVKDFAVLSPGPGEGKTTVASNISIALSQVNMKVLLVDTDIRRGRVHESYGLPNDKGLGHFLTEGLPLEKVTQKTEIPNLSIVTCGQSVIDSSQLFGSKRMGEFIRQTREKYDMVVYDTPPITIISDTAILVSQLCGSLMTVRSGTTGNRFLSKALTLAHDANPRVIGVVLNGVHLSGGSEYYKYYDKR